MGILLIAASFFASLSMAQTPADQFVGVLHHDALGLDQLAKLDFISSRDSSGKPSMMGVLTLIFGDFRSHEYISFHYEDVIADVSTQQLIFDQADQPVTIFATKFTRDEIEADVRNVWSGGVSHLHVKKRWQSGAKVPLMGSIWGDYEAQCEGKTKLLELDTSRYTEDTTKIGNALRLIQYRREPG